MNQSGRIYIISLDFGYGFLFAEILDFSNISDFDGILIQVYRYKANEVNASINVNDIASSGIFLGPMPINKYPVTKGKNKWEFWGKNLKYDSSLPYFKYYPGLLKAKNWSTLTPWFKQSPFENEYDSDEMSYEEIRNLETLILNHQEAIKIKCTMRLIIDGGKDVKQFYDLSEMQYRNMYVQVVNTYYDLKTAMNLLQTIDDLL